MKKRFAGRERSPPPSTRGHSHAQDPELLEVAKSARDTRIFKHEKETGPVTDACGNVPSAIGHQETDGNHGEPHRLPEGHGRAGQLRDQGAGGHSPLGKASSCVSRRRVPVCPGASWCTGLPTVAYLQTEETARCPREGRRGRSHRREATQQWGRLRSQHHPQRVAGSPETGGSRPRAHGYATQGQGGRRRAVASRDRAGGRGRFAATGNVPGLDPATQVQASESLRRALKRLVIHTRPWTEDGRGETTRRRG